MQNVTLEDKQEKTEYKIIQKKNKRRKYSQEELAEINKIIQKHNREREE